MENTFHYTNKEGWNGIRAQRTWKFKRHGDLTDVLVESKS
jgi:hypothetical protein